VESSTGWTVSHIGKMVSRGFGDALAEADGSLPTWLVFLALHQEHWPTQLELAHAVGIEGPTLTVHLDRMEAAGLVLPSRAPQDRRAVRVEPTDQGEHLFQRLRSAAEAFQDQLHAGFSEQEIRELHRLLRRLENNLEAEAFTSPFDS